MATNKVNFLRIKYKEYDVNLELRNKITILRGDSATGKTKLVELITAIDSLGRTDIIESSRDIIPLGPKNTGPFLDNKIYITDEVNSSTSVDFARNIKECNSNFIIINRDSLYSLNYGAFDIYDMVKLRGKIIAFKRYENIENKNIFNKNAQNLIEDSKLGYQFYSSILKDVKSTNGASNIVNFLSRGITQNIILDEYSIGPYFDNIEKLSRENDIGLLMQGSFEDLLNKSLFKVSETEYTLRNVSGLEQSAELKCKNNFSEIFKSYNKSKLNNWILEKPQKEVILKKLQEINKEFQEESKIMSIGWQW